MSLKKIALVLCLTILLGMGIASAKITRGFDDFTGGMTINSGTIGEPLRLKNLYFSKIVNTNPIQYEIQVVRETYRGNAFANTFIEIKIDDYPAYQITVKESNVIPLVNKNDIYSDITVSVPYDIVQKIKDAKRIALKLPTGTGPFVYVLPDNVLAEWKEVIAMEK